MADYLTRPKQAKTSMLLFYGLICATLFVFWSTRVSLVFLLSALTMALASGQGRISACKEGRMCSVLLAGHMK